MVDMMHQHDEQELPNERTTARRMFLTKCARFAAFTGTVVR
jgi:hypothetical protein